VNFLRKKIVNINGIDVNYVEGGEGQPMLFLHNGGGFWQSWEHQLKHFAEDYHVFGIDWPGFGESELPKGLISLELLTETLSSFITTLNLENVILIGNCIGGSAALKFNMEHPEKVKKLLIFNICPGDLIFRLPPIRRFIRYLSRRNISKRIFASILIFGFTKTPVKWRFPRILFGKKVDRQSNLFLRYVDKFKQGRQTTSRVNMVFSVHTFNLLEYLGTIKAPEHLLVWGEFNHVTTLQRHGYYHRDLLKSCQFKIIKNAGHLCMYESPDEVINLIESYILEN